MSKTTTIKEALKRWEENNQKVCIEAKEIDLQFQYPPIEKMDQTLSILGACQKLSLSTNMIEKICGINGMKNLRILSLSRNFIKQLTGLEAVSDTLEELWISYNLIEKVKGLTACKSLKVLYMGNNLLKEWIELSRLQELTNLEDVVFIGNPLTDGMDEQVWRSECIKRLPFIKKLDGETIITEEEQ